METDAVYDQPEFKSGEYVRYQPPRNYINMRPRRVGDSNNGERGCYSSAEDSIAVKSAATGTEKSKGLRCWKTFAIVTMIFVIFLVAAVAVMLVKVHRAEMRQSRQLQSSIGSPITSCLHLREKGETKSGYYVIQPDENVTPFETYCDMATSGGGWTLIASVHENNILGRCTTADMWYSRERESTVEFISRNWENKFTFGKARSATTNDYKNEGYYAINASDVMIRHSPNNEEVEKSKGATFLEYHTENKFLKNYGGNLHSVYSRHYNLTKIPSDEVFFTENNAEMLDELSANASDIISNIPDFYHYKYDVGISSSSLSGNGNNNMFSSYGMKVYISPCGFYSIYGNDHRCSRWMDVSFSSRKSTPFFALMTIGNKYRNAYSLYYEVRSSRYSNDIVSQYGNTSTNGNFTLKYNAYCRYGGSVPSSCDVFFVIGNKEKWKSSDIDFDSLYTSDTFAYTARQRIRSAPQNVVMGYTMLSRSNGLNISQFQTNNVLENILVIVSKFPSVGKSCENSELNLVQPVKYTIGGATALSGVPTSLHDDVTTGYMQFRARNRIGIAFAFCPAVRL